MAGRRPTPGGEAPLLSFHEAAVAVGGRTLWRDVDIEVAAGQLVAVLGPNGVGKTTLVKAILGLQLLSAGHLEVLGRPAGRSSPEIGYLPQRRSFEESLLVRGLDIVRLGLDGDRWGLPGFASRRSRREARRRVDEALALVGATAYANRPVGQVSGGEQQRILIAQALVRRPSLLLLDEPLESLDLPNQQAVAALLQRICCDEGVSVLIVAHDVNPLLAYLDQVVYLGGERVAAGPPEEVITSATLSGLYGTPVEVLKSAEGRLVVVGQPEAPFRHTHRHVGDHHPGHGEHG